MKEVLPYSDGGSVSRGGGWKKDCAGQLSEIGLLEEGVEEVDLVFGGLTDLELTFRLILLKLQTAGFLLFHPDQSDQPGKMELARACAVDALQLTEKLQSANVSLDQRGLITDSDEMKEIRRQFDMLLSSGGEVLFNAPRSQTKKQKKLIQAVQKALLKHTGPIHGTSETALAQEQAKIEIPEGEEEVNVSDRRQFCSLKKSCSPKLKKNWRISQAIPICRGSATALSTRRIGFKPLNFSLGAGLYYRMPQRISLLSHLPRSPATASLWFRSNYRLLAIAETPTIICWSTSKLK